MNKICLECKDKSNRTGDILLDPGGLLEPGQVTNPGHNFVHISFIFHFMPGIKQNTITKQVFCKITDKWTDKQTQKQVEKRQSNR